MALISCTLIIIIFQMINSNTKNYIEQESLNLNNHFVKNHLLEEKIIPIEKNENFDNKIIKSIKSAEKKSPNEEIFEANVNHENRKIPFNANMINQIQNNKNLLNQNMLNQIHNNKKNVLNPKDLNQFQNDNLGNNDQFLSKLERIVHFDLKGAPPKPSFFKQFIPFIKQFGATGVLLEYEDMFPFEGDLANAKNGNAYSAEDVNMIIKLAKENGLKIIPLVQTYGHLEWLLKVEKFAHLREVSEYPQVITPCLDESYKVIFEMIDQIIKYHSDVTEFHVGCDEVYYKLVHEKCANFPDRFDFTQAFMK